MAALALAGQHRGQGGVFSRPVVDYDLTQDALEAGLDLRRTVLRRRDASQNSVHRRANDFAHFIVARGYRTRLGGLDHLLGIGKPRRSFTTSAS